MSATHRINQIMTRVVACLGFFLVLLDASIVTVVVAHLSRMARSLL